MKQLVSILTLQLCVDLTVFGQMPWHGQSFQPASGRLEPVEPGAKFFAQ